VKYFCTATSTSVVRTVTEEAFPAASELTPSALLRLVLQNLMAFSSLASHAWTAIFFCLSFTSNFTYAGHPSASVTPLEKRTDDSMTVMVILLVVVFSPTASNPLRTDMPTP